MSDIFKKYFKKVHAAVQYTGTLGHWVPTVTLTTSSLPFLMKCKHLITLAEQFMYTNLVQSNILYVQCTYCTVRFSDFSKK